MRHTNPILQIEVTPEVKGWLDKAALINQATHDEVICGMVLEEMGGRALRTIARPYQPIRPDGSIKIVGYSEESLARRTPTTLLQRFDSRKCPNFRKALAPAFKIAVGLAFVLLAAAPAKAEGNRRTSGGSRASCTISVGVCIMEPIPNPVLTPVTVDKLSFMAAQSASNSASIPGVDSNKTAVQIDAQASNGALQNVTVSYQ